MCNFECACSRLFALLHLCVKVVAKMEGSKTIKRPVANGIFKEFWSISHVSKHENNTIGMKPKDSKLQQVLY